MSSDSIVRFENLTKRFGTNTANNNITLDIHEKQIHALLGENGSGKSTLMKILYGLYRPTSGKIFVRGVQVCFNSSKQAIEQGICMIHQHFMLVPQMTVLENIIAGDARNKSVLDFQNLRKKVLDVADTYGLEIDPDAHIYQLSVGQQQRVEIVKALYRGAQIMILDEPTSVLTKQETQDLLKVLRVIVDKGKTVIFITHKLEEVLEFADVCSILRAGNLIDTVRIQDTDKTRLSRMMIGRDIVFRLHKDAIELGRDNVLELENICMQNEYGRRVLEDVSLSLRAGEILGIAGVDGNGQTQLSEVITGMRRGTGRVLLCGKDISKQSVAQRIQGGVSFVPSERNGVGAVGELSICDNVILRDFNKPPFCKGFLLRKHEAELQAEKLRQDYNIKLASVNMRAELLSGGNLQKVILARELNRNPKVLVCVQPTRGLDVGAIEHVHNCILATRSYGTGVLLISTEMEEIRMLSDRIAIIFRGKIMDIVNNDDTLDLDRVGLLMAGVQPDGGRCDA